MSTRNSMSSQNSNCVTLQTHTKIKRTLPRIQIDIHSLKKMNNDFCRRQSFSRNNECFKSNGHHNINSSFFQNKLTQNQIKNAKSKNSLNHTYFQIKSPTNLIKTNINNSCSKFRKAKCKNLNQYPCMKFPLNLKMGNDSQNENSTLDELKIRIIRKASDSPQAKSNLVYSKCKMK